MSNHNRARGGADVGTMTCELMAMAEWFTSPRVTHVAMESTGVYWRAIFNLLEASEFQLLVANPRYMRAVPAVRQM